MTPPCTRNPADLLARDAALEQLLLGDVRELIDEPATEETRKWLLAVVDELLEVLQRKIRLEENGGYLGEVLDECPYPNWDRDVRELKKQHPQLLGDLRQVRRQVDGRTPYRRVARGVRRRLRRWIDRVVNHNTQETALLQTAINLEVGVCD